MYAGSGYSKRGGRGGHQAQPPPPSSTHHNSAAFVDPAIMQSAIQSPAVGGNVMRFFAPQPTAPAAQHVPLHSQQQATPPHHHHHQHQHQQQYQHQNYYRGRGGAAAPVVAPAASSIPNSVSIGGGRGGGRGGGGGGVGGAARKDYDAIVRAFMENDALTEIDFPSTLSAQERHHVHKLAMHFNLDHKSSGPADNRVLKLSKKNRIPHAAPATAISSSSSTVAAGASSVVNHSLFSKCADEPRRKTVDMYQGAQFLNDTWLDEHASVLLQTVRPLHQAAIRSLQYTLSHEKKPQVFRAVQPGLKSVPRCTPENAAMKAKLAPFRSKLPTMQRAQEIVLAVRTNRVTVICGDTGCGKTTQIPQLLLDAGLLQSESEQIICTQPRRISALSVAQRVAQERGQACGDEVGYIIRFENVTSRKTKVIYCTNGILLRRLHHDPELKGVRVVILDEVHERDADTDFSLLLLRELLLKNPKRDLRVVVMSATIQIERLVSYFTDANHKTPPPLISIPGTLFRVDEYFLEDALQWLKLPASAAPAMQLMERSEAMKSSAADGAPQSSFEALKRKALTQIDKELEAVVPYDLIVQLVELFDRQNANDTSGGVLVFLPGWGPIDRISNMLRRTGKKFSVFMLHSSITAAEQARVFYPPPRGFRKVVLATNVAETSITIDDITCVIDSGLSKGTAYDVAGNTSSLTCQLIAKANGIQRRGRAGRCRPGMCIHLLPRRAYQNLPDFLPPEILRTSLEEICLQIKAIKPEEPCADVLSLALDSPPRDAVEYAVKYLKEIGALDPKERPTNLGRALATMPLHPSLGKMLLLAACCGVLEPVAIIAASISGKSPFIKPMPHQQLELQNIQQELDRDDKSDHLTALRIYTDWKRHGCQADFAIRHLCDQSALRAMERTTLQLMRLVIHSGLLKKVKPVEDQEYYASRYASNTGLVRLVLLWSLMPRIATIERHRTRRNTDVFCWDNKPVSIHPSSLLNRVKIDQVKQREFIVYYDRMRIEAQLNIFDATVVSRTAALLCSRQVDAFDVAALSVVHALEDSESKYGPLDGVASFPSVEEAFADLRSQQQETETDAAAQGNPKRNSVDYRALVMDQGIKCFLVESGAARALMMLRETMDYYLSVAMKHVDIVAFPDALVTAVATAIAYPIREADPRASFRPILGGSGAKQGDAPEEGTDGVSSTATPMTKKSMPSWMRGADSDDDVDDKLLGSAEDDDDDANGEQDITMEDLSGSALRVALEDEKRLDLLYREFGDLNLIRSALMHAPKQEAARPASESNLATVDSPKDETSPTTAVDSQPQVAEPTFAATELPKREAIAAVGPLPLDHSAQQDQSARVEFAGVPHLCAVVYEDDEED